MNLLSQSLGRVYPFPTPRLEAPPQILCRVTLTRKLARKRKQPQKNAANAQKKMLQNKRKQRKAQKTCLCWHIGRPSGRFRSLWGRSWQLFGRSWVVWGRSWPLLARSWDALGASWAPLGRLLDLWRSWATFSHFFAFLSHF